MKPQPTVFVIDEDQSVRAAVSDLAGTMDLRTEAYARGEEFLAAYGGFQPGCVVLEVRIPGTSGLEIQEHLASAGDMIPLIFLTALANVPIAVRAMRAGAFHFLVKPYREDELWDAVRDAVRLDRQWRYVQSRRRELGDRLAALSEKEHQILELVALGKSNQKIASELDLSERTIQHHRSQVMKKLAAKSLIELVHIALTTSNGQLGHGPILPKERKEHALLV